MLRPPPRQSRLSPPPRRKPISTSTPCLLTAIEIFFLVGDLCRCFPLRGRPLRLVLRHGDLHPARLRSSFVASQCRPGSQQTILSLYKKRNDVEDEAFSCLIGGETAYCSVRGGMEGLALLLGRSAWLQDQAEKCSECCQILREVPLHQTRQVHKVFKLLLSFLYTIIDSSNNINYLCELSTRSSSL